jgi:glycosyltransferase involved in cell wall biosynthesis
LIRPINIGIYFPTSGSGGAQRHLTEILNIWKDDKSDVVFTLFAPLSVKKFIPVSKNIIFCEMPKYTKYLLLRFTWEICFSKLFFSKCSVLYVPLGLYLGSKRPIVSMSRNLLLFDTVQISRLKNLKIKYSTIAYKFLQLYTFKCSRRVILLSNYAYKLINNLYPQIRSKGIIINHGVSELFFNCTKESKDISDYSIDKPFNILYVSSFYEYKNHDNLIDTFKVLALKYPLKLTLVGSFPTIDFKKNILNNVNQVNETLNYDSIKIYEQVSLNEIKNFYHSSDLFVFPSSIENMPNALIEAMASALPVLCSNHEPMPEFLKNCGLYFDPNNKEDLQNKLETLINGSTIRKELSLLANIESKKYSWLNTANNTLSVLLNCVYK